MKKENNVTMADARSIKKLAKPLNLQQLKICAYRFNIESSGATEISFNELDGNTVLLSSVNQQYLVDDWELLLSIMDEILATKSGNSDGIIEKSLIIDKERSYTSPKDILNSNLLALSPEGDVILIGKGAGLYYGIDKLFLEFASQEKAVDFYSEPIWHTHDLTDAKHDKSLYKLEGFRTKSFHYWQSASCTNIWKMLKGSTIYNPMVYTIRAICCRNEGNQHYWMEYMKTFTMREITFVGTCTEVKDFYNRALVFLEHLATRLSLNAILREANDPFFIIETSGKGNVASDVSKKELRFNIYKDKSLAGSSANLHGDFFSKRFSYENGRNNELIWTGCLAFGIERWVWAILSQFGSDTNKWPAEINNLANYRLDSEN